MSSEPNLLIIGDTQYTLDSFYIQGALAMRNSVPYSANPYRSFSGRHDQWNYGHENENAGEHVRFGVDVLSELPRGRVIAEDPATPRDERGEVDRTWYPQALKAAHQASV